MKYLLLLVVAVAARGQYGAATSVVSGNGAPIAAQCTNANNVGLVWARKDGGAINSTFYVCSSTGGSSFGWELVGSGSTPSGGAVGGASSVASGQVLYGTGAGVAGSSANFTYSVGNSVLLNVNSGANQGFTIANASNGPTEFSARNSAFGANTAAFGINSTGAYAFGGTTVPLLFFAGGSERARFTTTGNLLLGTTTDDGTNRLQVAGSVAVGGAVANNSITITRTGANPSSLQVGAFSDKPTIIFNGTNGLAFETFTTTLMNLSTAGTLTLRNETPTTGVTQLIVRAGAGQSTTNLQTWQNSAGTALAGITGAGSFFTGNSANATGDSLIDANGLRFGSTVLVRWSNNLPVNAADISLSRAGVNIGQFGDGGSNSNGLLYLKGVRPVGSTVANLPTASGNTGMMATVTDATVTTIGTTVAGGGGNTVLVWSNGTNWRIYAN